MTGFVYIASPYSHQSSRVRRHRYVEVREYAAKLLQAKTWCYSPIVHCHPMANFHDLPTDAKYWEDYNHTMMLAASGLHVLTLPGWRESVGVQGEIAWWQANRHEDIIYA